MRKSPYKHKVKQHRRQNRTVHSYKRGKGSQPAYRKPFVSRGPMVKRSLTKPTDKPKAYTINFTYSKKKGDGESIVLVAPSYEEALAEAWEERESNRNPIEIELVDPDLGAALSFIRSSAVKAGQYGLKSVKAGAKMGAKFAVKTGEEAKRVGKGMARIAKKAGKVGVKVGFKVAKEAGYTALTALQKRDAQRLLKESYSRNSATRFFARATLKRRYFELYDKISWSDPRARAPLVQVVVPSIPVVKGLTKSQVLSMIKRREAELRKLIEKEESQMLDKEESIRRAKVKKFFMEKGKTPEEEALKKKVRARIKIAEKAGK